MLSNTVANSSPGTFGAYGTGDDWLHEAMATVRAQNLDVLPLLEDLRGRRFFRLYAADLLQGCAYLPSAEEPCELGECEVDAALDVPEELEARDQSEAEFELDSWARWDQPSDFTEYYDLVENPEGNTGYDGSTIWNFIHTKISFQKGVGAPGNEWKSDFNRAVSGLHSSVSCHIIRDLEKTEPDKALEEYRRRLRDEPDAVANLHFTFMLTLCGIGAARDRLDSCTYLGEGPELLPSMLKLTASSIIADEAVQQAAANLRAHSNAAGAQAWKLRMRTRDLLKVMNCVQCNQCRLHGKVSVLGLASALHVLLGLQGRGEEGCNRPPDPTSLHRTEIAALVTFAAKLSSAIDVVERFERLDKAE